MKIPIQHFTAPPQEYDPKYFAGAFQALETALRRVDFAPVYDQEQQKTSTDKPSKALYSTGSVKLDSDFVPTDDKEIVPKHYIDEIDAALQVALQTLDEARQAAEASLLDAVTAAQADIDAVKGDASLITFDNTTSVLSSTDVQDAIDEAAGDTGASGNVSYDPTVSVLTETDVAAALDEVAGKAATSGVVSYVPSSSILTATRVTTALDQVAGVSATTTGVIGVDTGDYPTGNNLAGVLADIDSRLTTLEP